MTLAEAFEAMRQEDRPPIHTRVVDGVWFDSWGNAVDVYLAESAICWSMVRALWDSGDVDLRPSNGGIIASVGTPGSYNSCGSKIDALAAAYAAAFTKEKA